MRRLKPLFGGPGFRKLTTSEEINQFLRARQALLTLKHINGQSFTGQLLRSEMNINTFGQTLYVRAERMHDRLGIRVIDQASDKLLIDASVNITDGVQKLCVTIDQLEMAIELGAVSNS